MERLGPRTRGALADGPEEADQIEYKCGHGQRRSNPCEGSAVQCRRSSEQCHSGPVRRDFGETVSYEIRFVTCHFVLVSGANLGISLASSKRHGRWCSPV